MRAGSLRTKCTFQQEIKAPDGYGGNAITWGNDVVVQCYYIGQSGRESLEAGRIESTSRATLRARSKGVRDIQSGWRVLLHDDATPWNVTTITQMGQRDQMVDIVIEKGTAV